MITWQAPSDQGSPITSYTIWIRRKDLVFVEDKALCDGSQQFVIDSLQCIIPLTILGMEPYNLGYMDGVYAKVMATNFYGNSPESVPYNGALMVLVPETPYGLTKDVAQSNKNVISFTWSAPLFDGGETITEYRVWYD